MLIRRLPPVILSYFLHNACPFSSTVAAVSLLEYYPIGNPSAPLGYLEGFPRPDPKYAETIVAIPRLKSGKNISAKERKVGRVPSIVFEQEKGEEGGNKRLISVKSKQIRKLVEHLGQSFFLSRLFELEVRSAFEDESEIIEKVRVLPRKVCCTGRGFCSGYHVNGSCSGFRTFSASGRTSFAAVSSFGWTSLLWLWAPALAGLSISLYCWTFLWMVFRCWRKL